MSPAWVWRRLARLLVALSIAASCSACEGYSSQGPNELHTGQTFVTGQSETGLAPHLIDCLADVLVKVSGDPSVASESRLKPLAGQARSYVSSVSYRDYMEGLPIGDEQGTRDRPYFVKVTFKPDKVDAILRSLGREPWAATRPRIAVILGVRNHARDYVLTTDGEWGVDQRSALADAAWRMGVSAVLPNGATPDVASLNFETIANSGPADFAAVAARIGGVPLVGTLAWADGAHGWRADFRLERDGTVYRWSARDVSFDEAFRIAMRGALQILSGHGAPG